MTLQEMRKRKGELGYSYEMLAEMAELPLSTVQKVLGGVTKHPRRKTIEALERVLTGNQEEYLRKYNWDDLREKDPEAYERKVQKLIAKFEGKPYDERPVPLSWDTGQETEASWPSAGRNMVMEPPAAYEVRKKEAQQEGKYHSFKEKGNTIYDYYALPDDTRVELIDGVFYDNSASPTVVHQALAANIYRRIDDCIKKHGGNCVAFIAPLDVCFDEGTMVQPDVFVVCDRSKIKRRIFGAPDLVIEIVSKTSRQRDKSIKRSKYCRSGVREYWIIDPEKKTIVVEDYEHEDDTFIYGFQDRVPIRISQGKCEVDFAVIYEEIAFLYDAESEEEETKLS